MGSRLRLLQLLAGSIPLAAALLMISVGPDQFTVSSYQTFRFLVTALIALGMAGFGIALSASSLLTQTLTVLIGSERRAR